MPSDTANNFLSLDENPEMDEAIDFINQIINSQKKTAIYRTHLESVMKKILTKKINSFTQHLFRNHK